MVPCCIFHVKKVYVVLELISPNWTPSLVVVGYAAFRQLGDVVASIEIGVHLCARLADCRRGAKE